MLDSFAAGAVPSRSLAESTNHNARESLSSQPPPECHSILECRESLPPLSVSWTPRCRNDEVSLLLRQSLRRWNGDMHLHQPIRRGQVTEMNNHEDSLICRTLV